MSLLNPMDDDQLDAVIQGLERIKALEGEIERLRDVIGRAASHWLRLDPGVTWEGDIADAMEAAVGEIRRLRLTDAERKAIGWAAGQANLFPEFEAIRGHADAILALLERTK